MNKLNFTRLVFGVAMILALVINSLTIVSAASFRDVKSNAYYATAADVLSDLGIISGYADGSFKPDKAVTRAEMAKLVCYLKGNYAVEDAENMVYRDFAIPFYDVDSNHWASPYIIYASAFEIINGYADGSFKPESPVSFEEAVKMILCATGFDFMVFNYPEDWAKGYIEIAETLGYTDNCHCQRGQVANRGNIAVMMYNTLDDYDHDEQYYEDVYDIPDYDTPDYDTPDYDEPYTDVDYGTRGPGEYLLTFEQNESGVIIAEPGYYKPGDVINIKAKANMYYGFMSWSSDRGGSFYNVFKKETTFTMPANDVVISALYIMDYSNNGADEPEDSPSLDRYDGQNINLNKYVQLKMRMVGCGSYRDLSGPYHPGQVVELKIGAGDEGIFLGWSSNDVDISSPYSPSCKIVIPDHDVTVTATFKE